LGDAKNASLQRIYGISFPDAKQMKEYKKFVEEAAKRDHRRIGRVKKNLLFEDSLRCFLFLENFFSFFLRERNVKVKKH